MPEIRLRHVVSCSSQDSTYRAENLLKADTYRKWQAASKTISVVLQVTERTDIGPIVSTNDSTHTSAPWNLEGPSHPEKKEKLITISLGYEGLPLYMGPTKLCINVSRQTWAFALPLKEDFRTLLGLFTTLFFVREPCLYY
uniref:Uncharacterized protein n=1 Tax=Ovis aries TaxID=9940 RepID=A0AC11CYC2_SHEEP